MAATDLLHCPPFARGQATLAQKPASATNSLSQALAEVETVRYFFVVFMIFSVNVMASETVEYKIDAKFIDDNDSWAIIEPLWWTVSIYDGEKKYEQDLSKYSKSQRIVFACHWYMSEVNNGGHDQFYYNSTGIVWRDAIECFDAIGATEISEIIKSSATRLGGSPSLDRNERNEALEKLEPKFDDLDDRFYKLESQIDIEKLIKVFISKKKSDFVFNGKVVKP